MISKLYSRYSGELQVVLKDNKKDKRVNVVGKVDKKDLEKLLYYNYGYTYKFVRKKIIKIYKTLFQLFLNKK